MPELAYRRPGGKAHAENPYWPRLVSGAPYTICGMGGHGMRAVPVEQVDPADLCKRCWPGRAP